jgi:transcriptional regulator with XRE-family HTH domain
MAKTTHRQHIGKMFKMIREFKKLSQDEVCQKAKVSRPTLSGLESGELNTSLDIMVRVASALNCNLDITLTPN